MPHTILDEYTKHHGSPKYTVEHYDLALVIKLASNLLDGRATLRIRALEDLHEVALNLSGLKIIKATCQGRKVQVSKKHHRMVVSLPTPVPAGERVELNLRYAGSPQAEDGLWGELGWEELTDGILVSGQPVGASTWYPCNDHPSHKSTYRFEISTDAGYRVVANGQLVDHRRSASRETWVYEQREPMASYLATLQIGRYQEIPFDQGGHLLAYAVPGSDLPVRGAFAKQAAMAQLFERKFGPYPFESYKIVVVDDELEIPLEAQGLSIFGKNHLSLQWEAQRLIAHELAHQWFGNSLTPGRWKDIWLNEGFACFSEWVYSQEAGVMPLAERARTAWQMLKDLPQDIVVGDPGPADMFDDRVYKRGALALYALMVQLGEAQFYVMLREWTATHKHSTVSTPMFAELLCRYAPESRVQPILDAWLFSEDLPPFPG
ncbi:M1 family metallopeptidase [Glutamicibacter arilaitensis]|uniref:Aminopeptidase N n=2 Tax=Glutamicibacter arilaitensis TaxID=256701 RepID=A0A2N7S5N0_9MICC|nr:MULTISPECIES: M1 family metallopeptidase [Glutamicibacter]PMQ21444.1 M1 family peptidase [Glutamicibacter arilaitensis]CBT75351.1 M1 family aminopeptidase [Glutamicibacter arilaitensis Re117]HCH48693.1 M1 family peptidase [Glutamicibacter sp.]